MTYMVECRRCGIPFDMDAERMSEPRSHGHGPEPRGWSSGYSGSPAREGIKRGTKVRLLHPVKGLSVGDILTVESSSPEHHSQNGGGYDIYVESTYPALTRPIWSRWLEVVS